MSATRDKNQKIAFVYSNLYQLYKKGTAAANEADVSEELRASIEEARASSVESTQVITAASRETLLRGLTTGQILKSEQVVAPAPRPVSRPMVNEYRPVELLGKRIASPAYEPILHKRAEQMGLAARAVAPTPVRLTRATNDQHQTTLASLRKNMGELNELHDRLRFMLKELEDLVKS